MVLLLFCGCFHIPHWPLRLRTCVTQQVLPGDKGGAGPGWRITLEPHLRQRSPGRSACVLSLPLGVRRRGVSRGQAARPDSRPAVGAQDGSKGPPWSCRWQKWRPLLFAQGWGEAALTHSPECHRAHVCYIPFLSSSEHTPSQTVHGLGGIRVCGGSLTKAPGLQASTQEFVASQLWKPEARVPGLGLQNRNLGSTGRKYG